MMVRRSRRWGAVAGGLRSRCLGDRSIAPGFSPGARPVLPRSRRTWFRFPSRTSGPARWRCISGTGDTIHTVISVTGAVDGTFVYYDHWEDGFELDLANPVQASSEVWGDGDAANGAPPGCAPMDATCSAPATTPP